MLQFGCWIILIDISVLKEIGEREGKFYAINVPLKDGIDDGSFNRLFRTVSSMKVFGIELYAFAAISIERGMFTVNFVHIDYLQGC